MSETADIKRLRATLQAIRSITIAAQLVIDRGVDPAVALRPAIRNIREAAEEALDEQARARPAVPPARGGGS